MIAPVQDALRFETITEVTWTQMVNASGLTRRRAHRARAIRRAGATRSVETAPWTFESRWLIVARKASRLRRDFDLDRAWRQRGALVPRPHRSARGGAARPCARSSADLMRARREELGLTAREYATLARLSTPERIQAFLNAIPANHEPHGETVHSVRGVLRHRVAHCIEGALVAACALGFTASRRSSCTRLRAARQPARARPLPPPRPLGRAVEKQRRVAALSRAVYRTLRELSMSYFHEFFDTRGRKTLRGYTRAFDLRRVDPALWVTDDESCWPLHDRLAALRHYPLINDGAGARVAPSRRARAARRAARAISAAALNVSGFRHMFQPGIAGLTTTRVDNHGMKQSPRFHPAVERWFAAHFAAPTAPQLAAWPLIKAGRNVLVAAPTGSGKTLAAFLAAIDDLVHQGVDGAAARRDAGRVRVAAQGAVQRHRAQPRSAARGHPARARRSMGDDDVEIRTLVRTGDTPQTARAGMRRRPPHILVTTPESLYVLLGSASGRAMLSTTRTVIVDEIHALAGNKRGSHLALSLERLAALTEQAARAHRIVGDAEADRRDRAIPGRRGRLRARSSTPATCARATSRSRSRRRRSRR